MKKRVVVALSGGVDSSFAAYLMLKRGYQVIALHMDLGLGEVEEEGCCGWHSEKRARKIAGFLNIPFYVINLREKFYEKVISYFISSYLSGKTPNPCVVCNRFIKFGALLQRAEELDGEKLVTGHYARIENEGENQVLKKGIDSEKEQSYFLFPLLEKPLDRIDFPLGEWRKRNVVEEVKRLGIPVEFRESQEVCFLNRDGIKSLLLKKMKKMCDPGPVITTEGKEVGRHPGICFFTTGQRRGLYLTLGEPYYVVKIIPEKNAIVVGKKEDVLSRILIAEKLLWAKGYKVEEGKTVEAKIRYRMKPARAKILYWDRETLKLEFFEPQWAITLGQAVVIYEGEKVVGGGWIKGSEK